MSTSVLPEGIVSGTDLPHHYKMDGSEHVISFMEWI